MKKISCLFLCALLLLSSLLMAGVFAEAAEADFAITLTADLNEVTAGQKVTLTATFANPETVNKEAKNNTVTWTVTDPEGNKTNTASVNQNGVVTTQRNVKEKTVLVVTATAKAMPTQTASVEITVIPLAAKVNIQADTDTIYLQDGYNTVQLTAAVEPADAAGRVTWKSSNEKVATVDENGLVIAVDKGTANITVTAEDGSNVRANFKLTVGVPVGRLNSMTCSGTGYLSAGKGGLTFSVNEFFDTEGNKITPTNKNITWSIEAAPASAQEYITIDQKGKLTAAKECPPALVKVTAAADGSLPAGSATYSMDNIYVMPSAVAEPVRAESMDDFYGNWSVFMTAGANGNPSDAFTWMNKLGGVFNIEFRVLEANGKPGVVYYVNGEYYGDLYAHLKDGALYLGAESSENEKKVLELCADGTMLEYIISQRNAPDTRVYCFWTSAEKQVYNTESEESSAASGDFDAEAFLDAVTEETGGIPASIHDLADRSHLDLIDMLYARFESLDLFKSLAEEGTCTFPALDGEWASGSMWYRDSQSNRQEFSFTSAAGGNLQRVDDQVTLTLDQALPGNITDAALALNYTPDTSVIIMYRDVNGASLRVLYEQWSQLEDSDDDPENDLQYSYSLFRDTDGSLHIIIDSLNSSAGAWLAEYDQNGDLVTKTFDPEY